MSDVHLGTRDCKAEFFLRFLESHEADNLYLVGDIFDGWALQRSWYWRRPYNDILQIILRKSHAGTNVVYIPGNHDEFARDFLHLRFGAIRLRSHLVHEMADGRRFLVLHGDEFDGIIRYAKWLAMLGAWAYQMVLSVNRWYNHIRRRLGKPYWSLSAYLKHRTKRATQFVARFEEAVVAEARKHDVDGVICGHIHHAELRSIGGIQYANSGDWVESCTALAEDYEGRLEIIRYADVDHDTNAAAYERNEDAGISGDGQAVGLPSLVELTISAGSNR